MSETLAKSTQTFVIDCLEGEHLILILARCDLSWYICCDIYHHANLTRHILSCCFNQSYPKLHTAQILIVCRLTVTQCRSLN